MSETLSKRAPPRRLWLAAVAVALIAIAARSSMRLRAEESAAPVALGSNRPQLMEFGMGVCEQCRRMQPMMERAGRELGDRLDVHVLDVRVEANEELARRFGLQVIPLVVLADGSGREVWRHEGFIDYEVEKEMRSSVPLQAIATVAGLLGWGLSIALLR
jgi:thioredoxin 1